MVADDLQPHDISRRYTPHIESIGAISFGNANTPGPLCTPSRYSILTGRHPSCHFSHSRRHPSMLQQIGINGSSALLPDLQPIEFNINLPMRASAANNNSGDQCTAPTIATHLRERGYATGIFGKWHLGYPALAVTPADRQRIISAQPSQWKSVKGVVQSEYKSVQQHVRRCGFDVAERLYVNNLYPEQHLLPGSMLFHNIEWVVEGARNFMSKPRKGPFFAYVGFTLPHNPDVLQSLQADPRFTPGGLWAANRDEVLSKREAVCRAANVSTEALLGASDEKASRRQPVPMVAGESASPRYGHRHYPLALAWLDSGVGELMRALKAMNDQNTLTIFTSDHAAFDKGHCYTGGSRIPMLLRWPAMVTPRTTPLPHLVSHIDLMPTILNAANTPTADDAVDASAALVNVIDAPVSQLSGRSLASLLVAGSSSSDQAEGASWQEAWAHGSPRQRTLFCEVGQSRSAFTSRYRLIWSPRIKPIDKGGTTDVTKNYQSHKHHTSYWRPLQFYDLVSDPEEQHNLLIPAERAALNMSSSDQRHFKAELTRLQEALKSHLDEPRVAHECAA